MSRAIWGESWMSQLTGFQMRKFPDCREIGSGSSTTEGEFCASECVDALHAHAHICAKMPPVGLEPATLAPAAQTLTRLTKMVTEKADQLKPKIYGSPDPPRN